MRHHRRKRVCGVALPHLGHPGWEELGILSAVDRAIVMGSLTVDKKLQLYRRYPLLVETQAFGVSFFFLTFLFLSSLQMFEVWRVCRRIGGAPE
jgi:hypothetical protein